MWSPTGKRIVFGAQTPDDSGSAMSLLVVNANGGAPLRIATNFAGGFDPDLVWSLDDAFIFTGSGYPAQLFRYSVFSPDMPKVLASGILPQLAPSGEWLAYIGWGEGGKRAIGVVNIDGTGQQVLHGNIEFFGTTLSWSPDSRLVAYTASEAGDLDTGVYVADVRTGDHRLLFDEPTWEWNAVWSPDGQWIAFVREGPAS